MLNLIKTKNGYRYTPNYHVIRNATRDAWRVLYHGSLLGMATTLDDARELIQWHITRSEIETLELLINRHLPSKVRVIMAGPDGANPPVVRVRFDSALESKTFDREFGLASFNRILAALEGQYHTLAVMPLHAYTVYRFTDRKDATCNRQV